MLAVWFDINQAELSFRHDAKHVQSRIAERIGSTDAALTALSGLFRASDRVSEAELRIMARELMTAYPHIYFAGHAWSIGDAERGWLQSQQQGDGFFSFEIKELDENGKLRPAAAREAYFPLQVIEPLQPAMSILVGLDVSAGPVLGRAFDAAISGKRVAATAPLPFGEIGTGYLALRVLRLNAEDPDGPATQDPGPLRILVLGLEASHFFAGIMPAQSDLTLCLHQTGDCDVPEGRLYLHQPDTLSAAALPIGRLRFAQSIDFHDHPLQLVLTAPIQFQDIHVSFVAVFAGVPLLISLTLAFAWRRQRSARQQSAINARLLRENEDRFRDFANATSDWFWETDAQMRYTYVSAPYLAFLRLPLDEVLGRTPHEVAGGEILDPASVERYADALQSNTAFRDIVSRRRFTDGSKYWVRFSAVPHFDHDGRFNGWRGVSTDVTEQQRTQLMLQQGEARFRHLLEAAPVPLAVLSNDVFVYNNGLARELLVGNDDELIGRRGSDFYADAATHRRTKSLLRRDGAVRNLEAEVRCPDGSNIWCEISAVETVFNDEPASLVGYVNVSERKQALEDLKESNDRFRLLTSTIPIPFVVSRVNDGKMLFANREAAGQFGLTADSEDGTAAPDWFAALHRGEVIEAVNARGAVYDVETTVVGPDGDERWIVISGQRLLFGGEPAIATAFLDITARKHSEAALRAAKEEAERANATKSQFLANMSHELRTPLNAIIGFSELMQTGLYGPLGDEHYNEYAKDIRASGEHLLQIINDILDLSRIEAGKASVELDDVPFADLAEDCLRFVKGHAMSENITLAVRNEIGDASIIADLRQMKQVLINLLSNAIKFTPRGGKVEIQGQRDQDGAVCLRVVDTGIGIAAADQKRILEPFAQVESSDARKHGGTGLGLPLARSLAELNGGSLTLDSELGHGTTVTLRFPAAKVRISDAA